jgi:hypothetical protein
VKSNPKDKSNMASADLLVQRVQTGVRLEKRLLKVLKALAEFRDMTLGDLLEGIVLHAFDGKCPFQSDSLRRIKKLKQFYGLKLDSRASHRMKDQGRDSRAGQGKSRSAKQASVKRRERLRTAR